MAKSVDPLLPVKLSVAAKLAGAEVYQQRMHRLTTATATTGKPCCYR